MTENSNVRIVAANLHNFVDNPIMQLLDMLPAIEEIIKLTKEGRQIMAAIQDGIAYANIGILGLAALNAMMKQAVEMILNTFDISYHQLILDPSIGGLGNYMNKFQMHLYDKSDANRPADQGAAAYMTVMFVFSFKDIAEAQRRIAQLKALFTAFEGQRAAILKAQIGYTTWDEVKEEFWGHYQKKYLAGSRAEVQPNGWIKHSVADIIGISAVASRLTLALDQMSRVPDPLAMNLSNRIGKIYDEIIGTIHDMALVVNDFKELLFDAQITVLLLPPVSGSASNIIPYIIPAYQNLGRYVATIPGQIDNKQYVDLAPNSPKADYSTVLRSDFYTTGLNMVFKGPSAEAAIQEARLFMALFGITIPDIPGVSEAFEQNVTPY